MVSPTSIHWETGNKNFFIFGNLQTLAPAPENIILKESRIYYFRWRRLQKNMLLKGSYVLLGTRPEKPNN